jgi:serine/threonine protein kinase
VTDGAIFAAVSSAVQPIRAGSAGQVIVRRYTSWSCAPPCDVLVLRHHSTAAKWVQVVHRDFKTSNILVDAKWNGVVADFGLARRMKTRGGAVHEPLPPECTVVMGTFGYVAPEYARTGALTVAMLPASSKLL